MKFMEAGSDGAARSAWASPRGIVRAGCLMALAVVLTAASPIIIRHDRPDEAYRALGERFADVNAVVTGRADGRGWRGQGTLIGPTWILTAAHVVRRDGDYEVQVDGRSYRVARIVLHPLFSLEAGVHDIALLELAEPVESDRYVHLYRDTDEAGLEVIKIGAGGFGDGVTGYRERDGVLRGATNRVALVDEVRLEFVFDAPGSEHVTEFEGIAGPGDSGNAALIESSGRLLIVGVSSHQRGSGEVEGKYGVVEVYERVSAYADWIDQVISASGLAAQAPSMAPAAACVLDFDSVQTVVQRDYAGFRSKAADRGSELARITAEVRAAALEARTSADCTATLNRWISFFGDPHLQLWEPEAQTGGEPGSAAAVPQSSTRDPRLPSLQFPDERSAVLRLPDFGNRYKPAIDSLIAESLDSLLSRPNLVIDVRNNGGGWTGSYEAIIPLLYTEPIFVHGMDSWPSEGNLAYARSMLESGRLPPAIMAEIRELIEQMERRPGEFVSGGDRHVQLDSVYPLPANVGIIIGRGCASTCEQFVLDARQSSKVTVFGTGNTAGFTDYGNVRQIRTPSGLRLFQVPMSRSRRLPANPMDLVGISPAVLIADGEPIEFVLRYFDRSRQ
jgi:hypothetical protein